MPIRSKNKILSHSSGFTLIELLVSISIIALISGIFMVNYHNTSKRSELNIAKQKLASDIRLAQNYALGSKTYDGTDTPLGGWGVHFVLGDNKYIIFADITGEQIYDDGFDGGIEIKTLPAGVTISSLSPTGPLDIVFLPPDPTTYVNTSLTDQATIKLIEDTNNSTAEVTVNSFGLIDTE